MFSALAIRFACKLMIVMTLPILGLSLQAFGSQHNTATWRNSAFNADALASERQAVGFFSGSFQVTELGTASYSIPIETPDFGLGVAPQLALTYNSNSANGELGLGWRLEGVTSSIDRCPKTELQDGVYSPVDFNADDQFCLDGQRLIHMGNNEYRTKAYSNLYVMAHGVHPILGPDYFTVHSPDGRVTQYSRPGNFTGWETDDGKRFRWVRVEVRFEGENRNQVTYLPSAQGKFITYGNISIQFIYENRPDAANVASVGHGLLHTDLSDKRLSRIEIKNYPHIITSYDIAYEQVGVLQQSRVKAIIKRGSDDSVFPPIIFEYNHKAGTDTALSAPALTTYDALGLTNRDYHEFSGDFNGDGFSDILSLNDNRLLAFHGNAEGDALAPEDIGLALGDYSPSDYRVTAGDFNGDGIVDLLQYGADGVSIFQGNARSTVSFTQVLNDFKPHSGYSIDHTSVFRVGDFNADGKSDLMHIVNNDYIRIWVSDENGFDVKNAYDPGNVSDDPRHTQLGDFNGDGRTDFIVNNVSQLQVFFSYGNGTFGQHTTQPGVLLHNHIDNTLFSTGDFNGDGITDLIFGISDSPVYRPSVFFGKGDGNFERRDNLFSTYSPAQSAIENLHQMQVVDVNGDGRDDIVHLKNNDELQVLLSQGLSTSANNQPPFLPQSPIVSRGAFTNLLTPSSTGAIKSLNFGDFNRDGAIDISFWRHARLVMTYYAQTDYSRLISSISTGRSQVAKTTINYGRPTPFNASTAHGLWAGLQVTSPAELDAMLNARRLEPAWPVVNSVETTYNTSGATNQMAYEYGDLRVHLNGGGMLGFHAIKHKNISAQRESRIYYSQNVRDFEQGNVIQERTYDTSVSPYDLVSSSNTRFSTRKIGSRYLVYPANSSTFGYAENGVTKLYTNNYMTLQPNTFQTQQVNACVASSNSSQAPCLKRRNEQYTYHGTASLPGFDPEVSRKTTVSQVDYAALGMQTPPDGHTAVYNIDEYTYERGLVKTHKTGRDSQITQTYDYRFDLRLPTAIHTSGNDIETRRTRTTYHNDGRVMQRENALGHTASIYYDDERYSWIPTRKTDANGLTVTSALDALGRVVRITNPDGTLIVHSWNWDWEQDSLGRGIKKMTASSTTAPTYTYMDFLGRTYLTTTSGYYDGDVTPIRSAKVYDRFGRVTVQRSANYDGVSDHGPAEALVYDSLGRLIRHFIPQDNVDLTYEFDYNEIRSYLNGELQSTKRFWPTGQLKESITGPAGTPGIQMHYGPLGTLARTVDPEGNEVQMHYNADGRKVLMNDPDKGTWTYEYYADGKMKSQTDAKGQRSEMTYDVLGRMINRSDRSVSGSESERSTWQYDSAANGLGKLYRETKNDGFTRTFIYDGLSRLQRTTTTIDSVNYTTENTYDNKGRISTVTYPSGFTVRTEYQPSIGVPTALINHTNGQVLQSFNSYTAKGQLEAYQLGELINGSSYYDPTQSGRLTSVQAWIVGDSMVNQTYAWDVKGNLEYREDVAAGWREEFEYDELNRLTWVKPSGNAASGILRVQYDDLGNITYKSDIGMYAYGSGRPHAVTVAGTIDMRYDANGSMEVKESASIGRQAMAYTAYGKLAVLHTAKDGKSKLTRYWYGVDRRRFKRVDMHEGQTTTTHYVGNYEKEIGPNGTVERLRVGGNVLVIKTDGATELNYLIKDHLGSTIAIFNADGTIKERLSYDPWGKRRASTNLVALDLFSIGVSELTSNRGYTGHEHIDSMGLIHMNGRVYDPTLGRFLSADPHIQAPENLQSYNRYSYVINNPLKYTDPSGYFFKRLFKGINRFVKRYWRPMLAIAAAAFIPGVGGGLVSGLIGSGGDLKAGLAGALSAGLLGGVHGIGGFGGAFAHGAIGGAHSRMTGGSFKDGFLGGVASFGLGAGLGGRIASATEGMIGTRMSRVISGGLIGGSAAAITGGNFKYGAWAGGFSTAFNDMSLTANGGGTAVDAVLSRAGKSLAGFGTRLGARFLAAAGPVAAGLVLMAAPNSAGEGSEITTPTEAFRAEHPEGPYLVRFGRGPETANQLSTDAARAAANGFPHGVSTKLVKKVSNSILRNGRAAPLAHVLTQFPAYQTGGNPNHFTVVLPNPLTNSDAVRFNGIFTPR